MAVQLRSSIAMLFLLVSCSTVNTTNIATPSIPPATQTEDVEHQPGFTTESPAAASSAMPNMTGTAFVQARTATEVAKATLVASFPSICTDPFSQRWFSPNGLWMTEQCHSEEDDSLILTVSKRDTSTLWKLIYRDYTQRAGTLSDEGFRIVHWSRDDRYAYISLFFHGDGGECFVGMSPGQDGDELLRLDLETGSITTILPRRINDASYGFSFAPTGRRLVYEAYSLRLSILDFQTGQVIDVDRARQFEVGGNYIWSPDGLRFVYSNVSYTDQWDVDRYSLRLVDGRTGEEQIIFDSAANCFAAKNWKDNHIIVVESFDPHHKVTVVEYDLNLKRILGESAVTPAP